MSMEPKRFVTICCGNSVVGRRRLFMNGWRNVLPSLLTNLGISSDVATMTQKYFEGELFELMIASRIEIDSMRVLHSTILRPLDIVFEIVKEANEWIDKQAPFKLIKESKEQTREVLGKAIGMIRFVERRYFPRSRNGRGDSSSLW